MSKSDIFKILRNVLFGHLFLRFFPDDSKKEELWDFFTTSLKRRRRFEWIIILNSVTKSKNPTLFREQFSLVFCSYGFTVKMKELK